LAILYLEILEGLHHMIREKNLWVWKFKKEVIRRIGSGLEIEEACLLAR